jgi:hypothetical protein
LSRSLSSVHSRVSGNPGGLHSVALGPRFRGDERIDTRERNTVKWWRADGIEPLARAGPRLQRGDGTSLSLTCALHFGCRGWNRTICLVGMSHASDRCSSLRQEHFPAKCAAVRRKKMRPARIWRRAEGLIPTPSPVPSRFERAPDACPVNSPEFGGSLRARFSHALACHARSKRRRPPAG